MLRLSIGLEALHHVGSARMRLNHGMKALLNKERARMGLNPGLKALNYPNNSHIRTYVLLLGFAKFLL